MKTATRPGSNLVIITALTLVIGLIFISVSSISEGAYTAGDKFYFINKQLLWSGIGIIAFIFSAKIKLAVVKNIANYVFFVSLLLLALTLIPSLGSRALGAQRWLNIGFIGIQPSEVFKLTSIIFFARLFSHDSGRRIKTLLIYLLPSLFLIIIQPNLSTAILIAAIIFTLYYLSGGEIISLFVLCLVATIISFILIYTSPYRQSRLDSLISLNAEGTASYHSSQMILALSSGHWTGKGFANSEQKYRYLPKISTDSIFAVIGEETGFIGCSFIIILYLFFIITIFNTVRQTTDPFTYLLATGIGCWLGFQSIINIAAVVGLIPLTGITLPLISYGGSSLVSLMFALGLVFNIQKHSA